MGFRNQKEWSLDFNRISRSHLYWGRKPTNGLAKIFSGLKPGDIFLDPFCGGATPAIIALNRGARVIASDINPMAVFLSKVLIQPISVFALKEAYEEVKAQVADSILQRYKILCPGCRKRIEFDYLKWNDKNHKAIPEAVKINCKHCRLNKLIPLSKGEISRQLNLASIQPEYWFPRNPIRSQRKTKVKFFHELFTGRNLASLAELYHAIEKVSSVRCMETLKYVFTAMLYSCSSMQMFSETSPASSRGWAARRFYLPPSRKEKNVWNTFEGRFKNILRCKNMTNLMLPHMRISNSMKEFEESDNAAFIYQADFLKFPFPKKLKVTHIFIDPPYIYDIDYIGFSEFWGSWLGMDFDIQTNWNPGNISLEENANNLYQLLLRIRDNTTPSCMIILAYDLKNALAWKLIQEKISKAGYALQPKGPIFLDNPQRKKAKPKDKSFSTDQYFLLQRKTKKAVLSPEGFSNSDLIELKFFLRVTSFLLPETNNIDTIIERASSLLRSQLQALLLKQEKPAVDEWIFDYESRRKAYNRFALILIKSILSQDGFRIISADIRKFDNCNLKGYDSIEKLPIPQGLAKGADFVAENDRGKKIIFCFFYDDSNVNSLKRISKGVFNEDGDKFRKICYLIVRDHNAMMKCRDVRWSNYWPRGFFIRFDKIFEKAKEIEKVRFSHMSMMSSKTDLDFRKDTKIDYFKASVIKNTPIGGNGDPKHFVIRFQTPGLKYVVPGQFVMVDTLPYEKRKSIDRRLPIHSLATLKRRTTHADIIDLIPRSFLKRPFSIHRTFYENFKWNYLKNMSLPSSLASITHTVFPNKFEIFYKLVENGTGTNELKEIKEGATFQVLGPLGKITTISNWRSEGIEEVHLIGGGVGMAPLMFFGQALKYYSFRIKAFIGIDRIETLYKAPFRATFEDDPSKVHVYVDNLMSIGLQYNDIYVSYEKRDESNGLDLKLSKINYSKGFVSQSYALYLDKLKKTDNILVLTCGPKPMLKALEKITSARSIRMKVLLEKRMGCGIGVCMSCVCRTKKNNVEQYSRVCTDGPLFDSNDIVWEKL